MKRLKNKQRNERKIIITAVNFVCFQFKFYRDWENKQEDAS